MKRACSEPRVDLSFGFFIEELTEYIQLRVESVDAPANCVEQFQRADLPGRNQLGKAETVVMRVIRCQPGNDGFGDGVHVSGFHLR